MKTLATQFTHDGFEFHQLARDGDVVLLAKSKAGHVHASYEVLIVQRHPAQSIHGREYPERESMPPPEAWGTLGWSYSDLKAAQTKFAKVVANLANTTSAPTPFPAGASQAS